MVEYLLDTQEADGSIPSVLTKLNTYMIVLLGSSYTRGAWGDHMDQPDAMLHSLLSDELGCDVANMSMPGHGSEQFVDAYVYACDRWRPRLFLAELVEDRSLRLLSIPNDTTQFIASGSQDYIYEMGFQYGIPHQPYVTSLMEQYHIHNGAGDDPSEHEIMSRSTINGFGLNEVLDWVNRVRIFHEEDSLRLIRSVRNFSSLEKLSSIVGIPVLYYRHTHWKDIEAKMAVTFGDRYMNGWHGLSTGVADWANAKLNGQHLADHAHLNRKADQLVVRDLMVPFIRHHLSSLDNIPTGTML